MSNFYFSLVASLVAQLVKPVIWETWVRSLGSEDPLEKGKATHFSTLNSMGSIVPGVENSQTRLSDFHFHVFLHNKFIFLS